MKLSRLRERPWFKWATNLYVLVLSAFLVWMVFFDQNSLLIHLELQREIQKLEQQQEFLREQIARDREVIETLSDPKQLEKFAREQYYLKKPDEEIYIIEYEDSLKNKEHDQQ